MSKSQRDKGKRIEREACELLRATYPGVRRSANQAGGAVQPDLEGTPYWIEVSGGAHPDIRGKHRQAERDKAECGDTRPILVLTHQDRGEWLATLWIGDLLDLPRRLPSCHP